MSKNIKDIFNEVEELNLKIKQILYHAEFENYEDLSAVRYDSTNPNELMFVNETRNILGKLEEISHIVNYLGRTVKTEGILHKNRNGKYELDDYEFSSGCQIEYLANDNRYYRYDENNEYVSMPYWCVGALEHNGKDYYIVGSNDVELEGLKVRIR